MRRYPLEAHLSGAVVTQQGSKDKPARASIGAMVRNGGRRIWSLSKYLSMYFLTERNALQAHKKGER